MNAYLKAMRNYGTFSGRATRSEFWLFYLVASVVVVLAAIIDASLDLPQTNSGVGILTALTLTAHLLPNYAIQARRLHDTDKSGWFVLLSFFPLPFLGILVLLVFYCLPSTPGPNRFGAGSAVAPLPTGAQPAAVGSATAKALDRLEKLASLKASGALEEAEFQKLKAEVLGHST